MRLPLRVSGLIAAAAVAGAVVYWRAGDRRRSRELEGEIDAGIDEGRRAGDALLREPDDDSRPFDQR